MATFGGSQRIVVVEYQELQMIVHHPQVTSLLLHSFDWVISFKLEQTVGK